MSEKERNKTIDRNKDKLKISTETDLEILITNIDRDIDKNIRRTFGFGIKT